MKTFLASRTKPSVDFPFYDGTPQSISPGQWVLLLILLAVGFAQLLVPLPLFRSLLGQWVPALLFVGLPLAGLAYVAPQHWRAPFRAVRPRHGLMMVGFAILNLVVSVAVAWPLADGHGANQNPIGDLLREASLFERVMVFGRTIPQLVGEEVLTLLPFLALLTFFHRRLCWSRRWAVLGACLGAAVIFGCAHLPTYQWNLTQCLVVIGSARVVLWIPYLLTKNLWVSAGAHIVNDWIIFSISLLGPGGDVS